MNTTEDISVVGSLPLPSKVRRRRTHHSRLDFPPPTQIDPKQTSSGKWWRVIIGSLISAIATLVAAHKIPWPLFLSNQEQPSNNIDNKKIESLEVQIQTMSEEFRKDRAGMALQISKLEEAINNLRAEKSLALEEKNQAELTSAKLRAQITTLNGQLSVTANDFEAEKLLNLEEKKEAELTSTKLRDQLISLKNQLDAMQYQQDSNKNKNSYSSIVGNVDTLPISGKLKFLQMDSDVCQCGKPGVLFHFRVEINDIHMRDAALTVYIYRNDGSELQVSNKMGDGYYTTSDGQIAVADSLTPTYQGSVWKDYTIFLPYDGFHLDTGQYDLKAHAELVGHTGTLLDDSDCACFSLVQSK